MAVANLRLRPQFRQRAVDFLARNGATLDINQAMGIAPEKANHAILCMNRDAIAISVLLWRRDDRPHGDVLEVADSLKRVAHLPPFDCQLMFVADVLIRAAPAPAKIRALRRDTIRRTFFHLHKFRFGELFFLAHDFCRNKFAFNCAGDENYLALIAPDAFAAETDLLNSQIDDAHGQKLQQRASAIIRTVEFERPGRTDPFPENLVKSEIWSPFCFRLESAL